jgi:hypothetical protein
MSIVLSKMVCQICEARDAVHHFASPGVLVRSCDGLECVAAAIEITAGTAVPHSLEGTVE